MNNLRNPVAEILLDFIIQATGVADVDMSLDLIESGLLDSLLIMSLVAFIDARFGVRTDPADISPVRFRSVNTLADWLNDKHVFIAKVA